MSALTSSAAWKALETHQREMANVHMRELFAQDPERFNKFSLRFQDLLLDYSKNRITEKTMQLLRDLARKAADWCSERPENVLPGSSWLRR